ncbi:MAG TPA: hypothetical protein VND65_01960, partial [Candidatus Binatia bacterium]|nr:hypothetical protein [Candidatus Binatia bacterium]
MFQACRPAGRLFYLALMVAAAGTGLRLWAGAENAANDAKSGRGLNVKAAIGAASPRGGSPNPQSGPALTSVVEVRSEDYGWGAANDRNLLGRFTTESFNLPRLAQTQNYFLRLYDSESP